MSADNQFKETMDSLFQGMNGVVSSKTVVGDAIHIGDTILLPLVDVSFAVGAGAFNAEKKERGAGGLGGKMTPCAVLVIQNGSTKLVNIKNQDTMTKILDMVPDVIDKFRSPKEEKMTEQDVADILNDADIAAEAAAEAAYTETAAED
ncbi:GerW family sporulation protein [Bariatricus massiliensis]|uniref:GerW family sporulation protein n=1 Tax=Bariatricus massiliensis TaxID=1745713 RepID=A0ABS8DC11_9FIRM|nr:GerW family sporulation protein [Bariatricus massiliensis]MCB7303822.1 GerW family sporulation protein [Bariatricus massiliensis]MCB7373238.1 GerW family sporulation protein [Bariatricus massiliensis]MCB7385908.1 GerW family sporulation protein [Bariatricus massiliensis]MCB7410070.1 GerW family sporulation protein [Bariatricus massiliensis]MCQ5252962.1 GerW family sporulation protein [Bariatricus massiliensis]